MSSKPYEQQHLDRIKLRQMNDLNDCPKAFFELVSFMQANLRKQFKTFSFLNLCQGSSHKLRFNDPTFEKAFGSMMVSERLDFYQKAVGYGIQAFGKDKKPKQQLDEIINQEVIMLLPDGFKDIQLTIHEGFRFNESMTTKIQKFKMSSRNHFHLNLQNYLLRESKKKSQPQTFILEAINKSSPQRVRFSFTNPEDEKEGIETLRQLAELAFRSNVISMILPETGALSPTKNQRRDSVRKSMGRLGEHLKTEQQEFFPLEQAKDTGRQSIVGGNELLEFSRHLASLRNKETKRQYSDQNNNILNSLLTLKSPKGQKTQSNLEMDNQVENIFNKVLLTQSDTKLPFSLNQNPGSNQTSSRSNIQTQSNNTQSSNTQSYANSKKSIKEEEFSRKPILKQDASPIKSPIKKFVSSQVEEYKGGKILKIKHKNIFQHMLPEFNIREMQPSVSDINFKEIYVSPSLKSNISQHITRPQRFQLKLIIENLSINEIYNTLVNQELLKKWNSCVDESQIKITLSVENCLICYEKHKRYSSWFKERDYLFLRHAFTYHQCKYIVDKSIEHVSFIPFQSIQRGYIRHIVTRLREIKENQVELIVDMSIQHGGYLGIEKRKELNMNFLKQYEKLKDFITRQRDTLSKMPTYCNNNWNIDWIDENDDIQQQRNQTLKTQDFIQSSIDQIGIDNVELQSQDFYSIQDEDQDQIQDQAQPSQFSTNNNQFQLQTTQGFQQLKPSTINTERQIQERQVYEEFDQNQSVKDKTTKTTDTSILLDDKGYCILPQKYLKKKHSLIPKDNNQQDRHKVYDNIVMKGDFVQSKDGGILLVNKPKIDAQNNVINFMLKTMRKNLLSGKSVLSISLPVEIFKADSNTQRLCESMTMGPIFLERAAKTTDLLERMKLSICFALSNSLMYFDIEKAFNPILGQTYQGMIDGCPIYAEQISHHPPISSLYFVGRGFRVHASVEAKVFLHLNSGDGVNQGYYTIEFDDGHTIRFQTAPGELSGFTIGDRKYKFKDKMYVYDKKNSYFATLNFEDPKAGFFSKSKWQHPDQMQGQILKVSPSFITKFEESQEKILPKPKQIEQSLSKMSGRWIHYLNFDDKLYYNIEDQVPYKLVNYEFALNSDARYRQDLVYRVRNDLAKSQSYKEELENIQRKDRKLREQYHGKSH